MTFKERVKSWLLGVDFPQEYLCFGLKETDTFPTIHLQWGTSDVSVDVTNTHLFLGYKPLIIGIPVTEALQEYASALMANPIQLTFAQPQPIAQLTLRYVHDMQLGTTRVLLFEGSHATHQLLAPLHQFVHRRLDSRVKKPIDPLQLHGNLYDQVRVAYAYPRYISLIALGQDGAYNSFPTDLNGFVGDSHYLISLRHNGKAREQVDQLGKLLIAWVQADSFAETYQMGKNHMKDLQGIEAFDVLPERSPQYQLPIPSSAIQYWELEVVGTHTISIHNIYQFKIVGQSEVLAPDDPLVHIHAFYGQWRKNAGLEDAYLLR